MIELALAALQLVSEPVDCRSQPDAREADIYQHNGETDYFPYGIVDAFECDWYSSHLASMGEPRLTSDGAHFRLRFLELPERDFPLSITVTHRLDDTVVIEARASNGQGGYDPGKLVYSESALLSARDLAFLVEEIEALRMCDEHPGDNGVEKLPGGEILITAYYTHNVIEWASGETYCMRHAGADSESPLTKLAIWLVQIVYAFEAKPPQFQP